jgi:hypothetical protein
MGYLDEILGYQQQGQITGRGKLTPGQVEAAFEGDISARTKAAATSRGQDIQEKSVDIQAKAQAAQESQFAITNAQAEKTRAGQQAGQETQSLIAAGGVLAGIFNAWNKKPENIGYADKPTQKSPDTVDNAISWMRNNYDNAVDQAISWMRNNHDIDTTIKGLTSAPTNVPEGSYADIFHKSTELFKPTAPTPPTETYGQWITGMPNNAFVDLAKSSGSEAEFVSKKESMYQSQVWGGYNAAYGKYQEDLQAYDSSLQGGHFNVDYTLAPGTPAYGGGDEQWGISGSQYGEEEYTGNEGSGGSGGE